MAKLVFIDKNFAGRVYELVLEKTTVGRGEQNTLVIRDHSLSSTHCEILMNGSEIIVRDLDSLNGTFVESVRLNKQGQAKCGQTIRFGAIEARLELEPDRHERDTGEITAVYALGKIMREQRRTARQPKPETASMQLDPQGQSSSETKTDALPEAPRPAAASRKDSEPPAPPRSKSRVPLLAILAALGLLIMLVWFIWGRK